MSDEDNQLIHTIAAFIAARLRYPYPSINGQGNPWVSTISVDQHKEKFWQVRVYCELAEPALIKEKWQWLKARQRRIESGEKFYRVHTQPEQIVADDPTPEFIARCLKSDAIYYREVYRDMLALRPTARDALFDGADHKELLYDSIEDLDRHLDELESKNPAWSKHLSIKYGVDNVASLKAYMRSVYVPSWRDRSIHSD